MAQTFFHCSSLKALDLSKLSSSSIKNTNRMFCGCESLLYINMNNLDLSKVDNATYIFYNMKEINYLEIKETKFNDKTNEELKGEYGLNDKDNLLVCKNEENFPIEKYKSICCDYDIKLKKCRNYIICKYKEKTEYENGFENRFRKNLAFIQNETSIVGPKDRLIIEANTTIEIYFSEPITSLEGFFSADENDDPKAKTITYIDLSHLDSSSVEQAHFLFNKCSFLEEINFNNFETLKLTNINSMFRECSNLKSLDLSNFITPNVTEIQYMFCGCNSLKYLDISNFDVSKVNNMLSMFQECTSLEYLDICNFKIERNIEFDDIFYGMNILKYINLYNAQINNDIKDEFQGKAGSSTIVCQNNQILSNVINDCSIFTQTDTYIIVKYGEKATYIAGGFKNQYRGDVNFIKYKGYKIDLTQSFTIEENGIIEIHLPKNITTLQYFFSGDNDSCAAKIISIDLSHLNSFSVKDTNNMFKGCSSLEAINFNNFDTSKVTDMILEII